MDEKCKKIMKCLSDYIDGEVSENLCKMVEQHLEQCFECRCIVNSLKNIVELLHQLPEEHIPEEMEKKLLERLRQALFN